MFLTIFLLFGIAAANAFLVLKFGSFLQKRIQFLHGPVYVPSLDEATERMIKLAQPSKQDVVADLGSGNGKLVMTFSPLSLRTTGYEIDPFLVWESRRNLKRLKLKNADIKWQSFWSPQLSEYDIVLLYMTASIMEKLEKKLLAELKPGARVVSQRFQFPNWKAEKKLGDCFLYLKK